MTGSNRRPSACKADALPAELILHMSAWRRPTLTGGEPPTTIGAEELNFRVRHGNGCDLFAIVTRLLSFLRTSIIITFSEKISSVNLNFIP
jgi:hypothetical protein